MIDRNCPCTKDCPDRSPTYCKGCEKGRNYKNTKFAEYEKRQTDFAFKTYEAEKAHTRAKAAKEFRKGILR